MNEVPFSLFGAAQALFYAVPIFAANMAPVLVKGLPLFAQPIDGGRLWRGQPILGSHKTWRGLLAGCLAAVAFIYIQAALVAQTQATHLALIDYQQPSLWVLGLLMGFGALAGDALKSFFKRRIGKASGQPWVPFDQLDFIIGALLTSAFMVVPSLSVVIYLLVFTPIAHVAVNAAAYGLGLKEVPY